MIELGKYYQCNTSSGIRTVKAIQELNDGQIYGIYSPSNYDAPQDNQGMIIEYGSPEATAEDVILFNNWYNVNG